MKVLATPTLICLMAGLLSSSHAQMANVASIEKKLQHVTSNGKLAHPEPSPTEFTDQEINSYFAAGRVRLPAGVQSVTFQAQPGMAVASAKVDFDQVKSGRNASNPLLAMFSGVHTVVVVAHAHGEDGEGMVHVDSVVLDDTEIPPLILQVFVQKFLRPKYPDIGIDSKFTLPDRVDAAIISSQKLTLTQK